MRLHSRSALALLGSVLLVGALLGGCTTAPRTVSGAPTQRANATVEQARTLARTLAGLSGAERAAAEGEIERLLGQLDDATLAGAAASLPAGDPLYNYAGRALLQRGLPLPRPFDRGEAWRLPADVPPADRDGYRPPNRIAVLLPLSGELATPAAPVRDGFLAGYYAESRRRPEVAFYNTAEAGALAAYDRAVADGSQLVIGPLGRDEVDALFARGRLPVPVLALNRGNARPPVGAASFSLSPEDEGSAAADYLFARGARRVLVVSGGDEAQRRATQALRDRLSERGATVVATASEASADFAPFAQQGGGADGVFLALRGAGARAVVPKLALAGLAGKPMAAISQLTSGTGKPQEDRALDGIAFPTEAWSQRGVTGLPSPAAAGALLPTAKGPASRLFAFGHDAWLLAAYLEKLT
ncbi:MAG TPA: penicillin-binding protein activator, partial [Lysobacter sp.]|nr:penicillin-binding protein activator [Lysobacter sp.]